ILEVKDLSFSIGDQILCEGLNVRLQRGQSLAVLGQNGTGKTTLLHTLLGLHPQQQGQIRICGRLQEAWTRKELARLTGMLFQSSHDEMPASVLEYAMMGRYPHAGNWQAESDEDRKLVQ